MSKAIIVVAVMLVSTLVLTPLARMLCIKLGMVDRPEKRRINKIPLPRGGGIAVVLAMVCVLPVLSRLLGFNLGPGTESLTFFKTAILALCISVIGFADDKWSLNARVKLLLQVLVASAVWFWADLGFNDVIPWLPPVLDYALTVFWIVGAINAFNLIDGLDGLASGIALIALFGMGGALWFTGVPTESLLIHIALMGAILGFLRYNYNPASVFLGDSGSMFLGYSLSVLPLMYNSSSSFFVSVGVPLLAMGVPIFDTFLAILRRSIKTLLRRHGTGKEGPCEIMAPDTDHIHHRVLRMVNLRQRHAAWILYSISAAGVAFGMFGVVLQSRAAGMWLVAVGLAVFVIFKSLSQVELVDIGNLLDGTVHDTSAVNRNILTRVSVVLFVILDVVIAVGLFLILVSLFHYGEKTFETQILWRLCLLYSSFTFAALVALRIYRTLWSRAAPANFLWLFAACFLGSMTALSIGFYMYNLEFTEGILFSIAYSCILFALLVMPRVARGMLRDIFYSLDCMHLCREEGTSRVLVYGTGLRFSALRREIIRNVVKNRRVIVGLLDDDILLKNRYIGGFRVLGTINDAESAVRRFDVDTIVIACQITDAWRNVVIQKLSATGVKVVEFGFSETELLSPSS